MSTLQRTLPPRPQLFTSWEEEADEHGVSWWELFVDLLLVLACSVLSDHLNDNLDGGGIFHFLVYFSIFLGGSHNYSYFNTRFTDLSLVHNLFLFMMMLGMAGMCINATGLEYIRAFSVCAAIQRMSQVFMELPIIFHIPKARRVVSVDITMMTISAAFCGAAGIVKDHDKSLALLASAAVFENFLIYGVYLSGIVQRNHMIPIHIDHSNERQGCVTMVVLGESIVSTILNYHERKRDPKARRDTDSDYLIAMGLSLLLLFGLGLLYYGVSPPRQLHAYRRSRPHGISFQILHLFLFWALLGMGTALKALMTAVFEDKHMDYTHAVLMFGSLTVIVATLIALRTLHYWGRTPLPTDTTTQKAIMLTWWATAFFQVLFTLSITIVAATIWKDAMTPFGILGLSIGAVNTMCLLEYGFIHLLASTGYEWPVDRVGSINETKKYGGINNAESQGLIQNS
eukprot:m.66625 g.66625  ORF g.66625 m.66625 type:complete len:456 (+) comp11821_c1_seq1:215-1582(+)